jgi:NAD(P)-dependent dehydrogenase (short-subunit alcohol dehydrogenase family)
MREGAPILLVTGGSRGIGAAICQLAATRGYDVAVNYHRGKDAAAAVVEAIETAGQRGFAVQGDMAIDADVDRVFSEVDRKLGRLSHLVYNSGITGAPSRFEMVKTSTLREVMDVNVMGAFYSARAAIPRISTRQGGAGGAIVFISSAASTIGSAGEYVWYAASKAAIDGLTVGLSRELAEDGIRVNAVAPGPIETEIHAPGRLDRVLKMVPLGRAGKPQEIAEAVLFLLSEASAYTTGAILRIGGGR